jgi:hypothetical protein
MKGLWRRIWLYLRVAVLVLVVAFVVQFLLINTKGSRPVSARIVFWEDDGNNLGAILVAAALGAMGWPLVRLARLAWRDHRAEKQRRHDLAAEADWQGAKAGMESHPVNRGTAQPSTGPQTATATDSASAPWIGQGADDQENIDRRVSERRDL